MFMMKIRGVAIVIHAYTNLAKFNASFSDCIVAHVLGVISPKINITNVNTPVAIPGPMLPNQSVAMTVAREDAERLTILFPIRRALSILP